MPFGYTNEFSEEVQILDTINPVSSSAANAGSWVSAAKFNRLVAKLNVGAIAATGTVDFKIEQAKDAAGTGVKALKSITQLIDTDDNKQRWIEVRNEELDVDGGFDFVKITVTCATAASLIAAELLGFVARYHPVVQPAGLTVTH